MRFIGIAARIRLPVQPSCPVIMLASSEQVRLPAYATGRQGGAPKSFPEVTVLKQNLRLIMTGRRGLSGKNAFNALILLAFIPKIHKTCGKNVTLSYCNA